MREKSNVYVVERMPFDYAPAASFGNLVFIEGPKMAPDAPNEQGMCQWNAGVVREARKSMADYIPGLDYVIPTGSPVRMMMAGMLLASISAGPHRILKWDDRTHRYLCHTLEMK